MQAERDWTKQKKKNWKNEKNYSFKMENAWNYNELLNNTQCSVVMSYEQWTVSETIQWNITLWIEQSFQYWGNDFGWKKFKDFFKDFLFLLGKNKSFFKNKSFKKNTCIEPFQHMIKNKFQWQQQKKKRFACSLNKYKEDKI